jgi:lipopolysaccharide export system permease protein
VVVPFVAVGGVLTAIFTTYSMTRFLDKAADGLLQTSEVLQLTLLKSVIAQEVLWPVSLFVALVIAMGRLYSDWEMTALRSFGFAEYRILLPIVSLAMFLALIVGIFSFAGRPWAYERLYRLEAQAEATSDLDRIKSGRFYLYDDDARAVFIEQVRGSGDRVSGLFIRSREGDDIRLISAPNGVVREFATADSHELTLQDAQLFKKSAAGTDFLGVFDSFKMFVPIAAVQAPGYRPKSQSSLALRASGTPVDQAEYQWRLSTPVSTMLLALLAVPLGRSRPRQGRFARLTGAVVIYAIYFNLLGIGRTWVEQGSPDSMWWVSSGFALFVVAFYVPWHRLLNGLGVRV